MILKFPRALRIEWSELTGVPVVAIACLVVTGLVVSLRPMRGLQSLELVAFDRMVQLRPQAEPDPRLLVVAITEEDLKLQKHWPISDEVLAQVLANLQKAKPRLIGLDMYRNLPQPPGESALTQQFQAPNVIVITKLGDADGIPAPATVANDRVGFNDVVADVDGVIRRNFMFGPIENTDIPSLSLLLAQRYLAAQQLLPQQPWNRYERVQWGQATFSPLEPHDGAYYNTDAGAYQILLNYRTKQKVAAEVTLTEVLNQEVDSALIRDKIVLIGATAPSLNDKFFTPYSSEVRENKSEAGENSPMTAAGLFHTDVEKAS